MSSVAAYELREEHLDMVSAARANVAFNIVINTSDQFIVSQNGFQVWVNNDQKVSRQFR
jgi:hypothetical protein